MSENESRSRFHQDILSCQLVTPMFLRGANQNQVEWRASSFKGMFRFWWRALYGNHEGLRNAENRLFGENGKSKSPFSLRLEVSQSQSVRHSPTPHNPAGRGRLPAFPTGQEFHLILTTTRQTENHELYVSLAKLSLLLGGVGARSRRGFGSVCVEGAPTTLEDICKLMNQVNRKDNFEVEGSHIRIRNKPSEETQYPYVESVQLGRLFKTYEDALKEIGRASSKNNSLFTGFTSLDLNRAKKSRILKTYNPDSKASKRMASPIYVTVINVGKNDYRPLITTLRTAFESTIGDAIEHDKVTDRSNDFKEALL